MKKKKWQKFILIAAFVFGIMSASASAQVTEQDEVHVGDILEIDGHMEQVFRVNDDGSYHTIVTDGTEKFAGTGHRHENCAAYKRYSEMEVLVEKESCYRIRNVILQKCRDCGYQGLEEHSLWEYVKHDYSITKGSCKICGRETEP